MCMAIDAGSVTYLEFHIGGGGACAETWLTCDLIFLVRFHLLEEVRLWDHHPISFSRPLSFLRKIRFVRLPTYLIFLPVFILWKNYVCEITSLYHFLFRFHSLEELGLWDHQLISFSCPLSFFRRIRFVTLPPYLIFLSAFILWKNYVCEITTLSHFLVRFYSLEELCLWDHHLISFSFPLSFFGRIVFMRSPPYLIPLSAFILWKNYVYEITLSHFLVRFHYLEELGLWYHHPISFSCPLSFFGRIRFVTSLPYLIFLSAFILRKNYVCEIITLSHILVRFHSLEELCLWNHHPISFSCPLPFVRRSKFVRSPPYLIYLSAFIL
jgi:hypothetical protein